MQHFGYVSGGLQRIHYELRADGVGRQAMGPRERRVAFWSTMNRIHAASLLRGPPARTDVGAAASSAAGPTRCERRRASQEAPQMVRDRLLSPVPMGQE